MSIATENFVKIIYQSEQRNGSDTKPGSIARELGISNAAATDMARKLAEKKLVNYEKYQPLQLTDSGIKMALNIIRKHRLWETFLYETFHLSLHEIHIEAELLEHQTSDFLAEKISTFLGNPEFDPHGDPIPTPSGTVSSDIGNIILSQAETGEEYEITRLFSSDSDFFEFCNANHLTVGSRLRVENHFLKSKMTGIVVEGTKLLLNADFTNIMYVKKV
jgi:DtxR family Mn-dependent transcriptional regulator